MKIYFNEYQLDGRQWEDLSKYINSGEVQHRELENHKFTDVLICKEELAEDLIEIIKGY